MCFRRFMLGSINKRYKETYTLPFDQEIPNYIDHYSGQIMSFYRIFKFFKRYLLLFVSGQLSKEKKLITSDVRKIIWINLSASSLGDSLMDLSSRTLLEQFEVDLITSDKNSFLYADDKIFNKVFTDKNFVEKNKYDLVIMDSYSSRTLKVKTKFFRNLNFVSMFGFFNGPEVNRVMFSFHKMNHLLKNKLTPEEIRALSKPSIFFNTKDINFVKEMQLKKPYIAIAIGGEWSYRTYKYWDIVVKFILKKYKSYSIVLLGSENGVDYAKQLELTNTDRVINYVNRLSFKVTSLIINESSLFICCDGGLMHASNAELNKIIPLFARLTPSMQLTDIVPAFPLFNQEDVNNISAEKVNTKISKLLSS